MPLLRSQHGQGCSNISPAADRIQIMPFTAKSQRLGFQVACVWNKWTSRAVWEFDVQNSVQARAESARVLRHVRMRKVNTAMQGGMRIVATSDLLKLNLYRHERSLDKNDGRSNADLNRSVCAELERSWVVHSLNWDSAPP
jgi:hypothetical protein